MEKWLAEIAGEITIEKLPEQYREIAGIVGIENTLRLAKHLGGLIFYFPELDSMLRKIRDDRIRREFTGFNHKDLARRYGLSEIWIRKIVQANPGKPAEDSAPLLHYMS